MFLTAQPRAPGANLAPPSPSHWPAGKLNKYKTIRELMKQMLPDVEVNTCSLPGAVSQQQPVQMWAGIQGNSCFSMSCWLSIHQEDDIPIIYLEWLLWAQTAAPCSCSTRSWSNSLARGTDLAPATSACYSSFPLTFPKLADIYLLPRTNLWHQQHQL